MPRTPIASIDTKIHAASGRSLAKRAMNSEPTTKPTEVRPSCNPYSNSVAPRSSMENGRSRTFHRPKATNMNAPTMNSERMMGVPNRIPRPSFRLATMTLTFESSSGSGIG